MSKNGLSKCRSDKIYGVHQCIRVAHGRDKAGAGGRDTCPVASANVCFKIFAHKTKSVECCAKNIVIKYLSF